MDFFEILVESRGFYVARKKTSKKNPSDPPGGGRSAVNYALRAAGALDARSARAAHS